MEKGKKVLPNRKGRKGRGKQLEGENGPTSTEQTIKEQRKKKDLGGELAVFRNELFPEKDKKGGRN